MYKRGLHIEGWSFVALSSLYNEKIIISDILICLERTLQSYCKIEENKFFDQVFLMLLKKKIK